MIAKTETLGGCKILRVSGRIDFESALDFEHQINSMIQEGGDCFIIELSQVELLSSAGLRVMLSTAKRVAHRNASLGLAAPSQVVRQVFEISHFNLLFKIFPSVPAAIAALKDTTEFFEEEGLGAPPHPVPSSTGQEDARSTNPVIPNAEHGEKLPPAPKVEATPPEPPPSVLNSSPEVAAIKPEPPPPVVSLPQVGDAPAPRVSPPAPPPPPPPSIPRSAETPTVAPPAIPRRSPESKMAVPKPPETRQTPPPLPSPATKQSAPVLPAQPTPATARSAGQGTRREAKYPALLEVRAEGRSYPCKDGDVIGTEGRLAQEYFGQITNLAPRHLLIGQAEGRWFVFTPKNVPHPFILDGVVLRAGERRMLQYLEHQVEFSGHVFGFRLVAQEPKKGFLSRIFGPKK
jgi:anti-anti-sigma factor